MSIRLHCDGPHCDKSTHPDHPGLGWVRTESISAVQTMEDRRRESHYCSPSCERAHAYLLISGDNGK